MARLDWAHREQLLLEAIRDLEDDDDQVLGKQRLAAAIGLPEGDVGRGLKALLEGDFIRGMVANDYGTPPGQVELIHIQLAPTGRVHVRQWPGQDAAAALLEVLDETLAGTDDPEQETALTQVRTGLLGLGGKVLTEIAVGYAKRVSGLA